MAEQMPLTLDTFMSGEATDLVNFSADVGTDRDRGQFEDSPYGDVPYGRDVMLLLNQRFPSPTIQRNVAASPALEGLGAAVAVQGQVGAVVVLGADVTFVLGGLASASRFA